MIHDISLSNDTKSFLNHKKITKNFLINRFMESEKKRTQNSDNCKGLNGVNLESYTYFRVRGEKRSMFNRIECLDQTGKNVT